MAAAGLADEVRGRDAGADTSGTAASGNKIKEMASGDLAK